MNASEANELLKVASPGTFLVRSRATNPDAITAPFALSIKYELTVLNYLQSYKNLIWIFIERQRELCMLRCVSGRRQMKVITFVFKIPTDISSIVNAVLLQ